jgi:RimJ/RimL family protein N-acetyltransferase
VRLTTARLVLRDFVDEDLEQFHAVEGDPEVARYQSFEPRTPADTRYYLQGAIQTAGYTPRRVFELAIVLTADDQVVGRCGLGVEGKETQQGNIWYTLRRDLWNRGYTTEAAQALVAYGFRELALHRVWADCDPANVGSWRVMEKLGMRREAHHRQNRWLKGAWHDTLIYAVLAEEWAARA